LDGETGDVIAQEPRLAVGIISRATGISGVLNGVFRADPEHVPAAERTVRLQGPFGVFLDGGKPLLRTGSGEIRPLGRTLSLVPEAEADFTLNDVTIGVSFHWERREAQTFPGGLTLLSPDDGTLTAINVVPLETYLASVISSEMSALAPPEFLKAHAVTSRSWLAAMLARRTDPGTAARPESEPGGASRTSTLPAAEGRELPEIRRWTGREAHAHFDVCADDHCQRYQGMTKIVSPAAAAAVSVTRGVFLTHAGRICDARYHKACGGLTEPAQNVWAEVPIPYLTSVADADGTLPPVRTEAEAAAWFSDRPDVHCRVTDPGLLARILPDFDRETADFFRWSVSYEREELEGLLKGASGIDFGTLLDLMPLTRGPSGRISRLRVTGTKHAVTVGRELEIRRWLSKSHLFSSAFVVRTERDHSGIPMRFHLAGGGWGHGVGLCQIGAAALAARGRTAEQILAHYFPGATVTRRY
jgi:peptidoglycan hydrolase-like amidase